VPTLLQLDVPMARPWGDEMALTAINGDPV
jgi:hypothetical protein